MFRVVCLAVAKRYTDSGALGKGLLFTGETLHIYLLMFRSVSFIYNEEVRSTNEVVMVEWRGDRDWDQDF